MSTLISILADRAPVAEDASVTSIREGACEETVSRAPSLRDEQMQALVEQLFFPHARGPLRYVGFADAEPSRETGRLCYETARILAENGRYDVGLIDARPGGEGLQAELEVAPIRRPESTWPMGPRLWLVPRESWLPAGGEQHIPEQSFSRLRELITEFDFAILCCPSVSWLTTRIGRACDGLVLVLTANRTRRLVAAQMKALIEQAHVPLLGTVLAARRFPVPEILYRKL